MSSSLGHLRRSGSGRARSRRAFLGTLLGPDLRGAGQSLVALGILAIASVGAGLTLGGSSERLEELPGLLLMVPAAIALRGNVFGALGSRLGTAIHAGTFRMSLRPTSVVGSNVFASLALTLGLSLILAVMARAMATSFGLVDSMSLSEFVVISVVGGFLASVVVLVLALALAAGSVRNGWDPDNVTAPLVTAAGDVVTLPALVLASRLVDRGTVTLVLALAVTLVATASIGLSVTVARRQLGRIVGESLPVLVVAVLLDLVAGVTIERQIESFAALPALLVLLPGYLAGAGALGGILSSRLSSKLHLGMIAPVAVPSRPARSDLVATLALAVPVFLLIAVAADGGSDLFGLASPGLLDMVAVTGLGAALVVTVVLAVAYYGTIASVRFGVDPDTYGIPLVTSVLDFTGAFTLVFAIEAVGVIG